MKTKNTFSRKLAIVVLSAVCIAAAIPPRCSAAEEKKYTFGLVSSLNPAMTSQLKQIFKEIFGIMSSKYGINIGIRVLADKSETMKAVEKKELDIIISTEFITPYIIHGSKSYSPVMAYSLYGKKKAKMCVYVRESSGVKDISGLAGKKLITYLAEDTYYLLRELAGEAPEKLFQLQSMPDGATASYALAMDAAAGVFLSVYSIEYLKKTNPATVKDIRELGCTVSYYAPPMLVSNDLPDEVLSVLNGKLLNLYDDDDFKKFRPLLKTIKMKFFPVQADDYKKVYSIFDKAYKNGWEKDYNKWHKYMKEYKE